MLGPNHQHHDLAKQMHSERLSHSARIQMIAQDRRDGTVSVDRAGARRLTAARLAAGAAASVAAVALSFSLAATAAATSPALGGGGGALIR